MSSGLTASSRDVINCDCAEEVGTDMQQHSDSASFMDVSLKRRDCVKMLQQLCKGLIVDKKTVLTRNSSLQPLDSFGREDKRHGAVLCI